MGGDFEITWFLKADQVKIQIVYDEFLSSVLIEFVFSRSLKVYLNSIEFSVLFLFNKR